MRGGPNMKMFGFAPSVMRIARPRLFPYLRYCSAFSEAHSLRPLVSTPESLSSSMLYTADHTSMLDPEKANQKLVNLVKNAEIAAAYRLRLQMEEEGVQITPHPVFEDAAVRSLAVQEESERLSLFTSWFSLIPGREHVEGTTAHVLPIIRSRRELFKTGFATENIPLVMDFGLICAAKGYLQHVFFNLASRIVRSISPEEATTYLLELQGAATLYERAHQPHEAPAVKKQYLRKIVDTFCKAGMTNLAWTKATLKLLQENPDVYFSDSLFRSLHHQSSSDHILQAEIKKLWTTQLMRATYRDTSKGKDRMPSASQPEPFKYTAAVPLSEAAMKYSMRLPPPIHMLPQLPQFERLPILHIRPAGTDPRDARTPPTISSENRKPEPRPDVELASSTRSTVAEDLEMLKQDINGKVPMPYPGLRDLFERYHNVTPAMRALPILFKRAVVNWPVRSVREWLLLELYFRYRLRQYETILSICREYIDVSHLPLPFRRELERLSPRPASDHTVNAQRKIKIFKSPSEFGWVMISILRLGTNEPRDTEALTAMYNAFLSADFRSPVASVVLSEFIRAFSYCSRPDLAEATVTEMKKRGLIIKEAHYGMLAGAYANVGDVIRALAVLDRIERTRLKTASIVTYSRIFRGFLKAGLVKDTEEMREIAQRLTDVKKVREIFQSLQSSAVAVVIQDRPWRSWPNVESEDPVVAGTQ